MASLRQIRANQLNAGKSTGPTTPEGKAVARRNALKHGLAGTGIVLPEDEAEAINERWAQWQSALKPDDAYSDWLVERIAATAIRLERCEHHERALLEIRAARAGQDWDLECRLAAESLGESLPKAPGRVALELRRTAAGRAWLLMRWEALGAILEAGKAWDDAQRSLALDLLGTPPALRSAPTRADADAPARLALVRAEQAALRAIEPGDAEALERTAAELGLGPVDRELALARRYGRSLSRQLNEFRRQLKLAGRLYQPAGFAPAPAPARVARPAPALDPAPQPEADASSCEDPAAFRARQAALVAASLATPAITGPPADLATPLDAPSPRDRAPTPMKAGPAPAPAPNRKARRATAAQSRRGA